MLDTLGISVPLLLGQLTVGLINGAFYATLSLGLAVIFGLLNVINFAHGTMYMLGAFVAWVLLDSFGLGYWPALLLAPIVVGLLGVLAERLLLKRIYQVDHIYGLLLTLGLSLVIEGFFHHQYGNAGQPYAIPPELVGGIKLGFMFLPNYRAWVIAASLILCLGTWALIEKTKLGAYLRAASENPMLVRAFGVRVPRMITLTYGLGVGLAALSGVMAAPIYQVTPSMGSKVIIIVFAVVVIGGMGSILGAIVTGFALGLIEGLTKYFYPAGSSVVIFVVMAMVLLIKPAGLFGKQGVSHSSSFSAAASGDGGSSKLNRYVGTGLLVFALIAPFIGIYPGFLMKALCFAVFACAFNLLIGYAGLMSFGHAAFFGIGAYIAGYAMKEWSVTPEVSLLACTLGGALLGLVFGLLAIRRQGIYFAMVTLALSEMFYFLCVKAPITGGEDGLRDVPHGMLFGFIELNTSIRMYFFVLAVFLLGFYLVHRTIHSPFGNVLKAIRENEPRAISLGYKTNQCKLIAFVISAALAGLAGGTKTLVFDIAALSDVHWAMSAEVILMTLIGGIGTVLGPVVGAILLTAIEGYLAPLGAWVTTIQGVAFIGCVLMFRRGLIGTLFDRKTHRVGASAAIGGDGTHQTARP